MNILTAINTGVSVILAIVLHELAHGFVSYKLGDPTPKIQGRLTLNPLAHLDPIGTLCLFFFGFGWAKPVGINYDNYKNKKLGTALVSLAGPCMNFLIAIIAAIGLKLCNMFNIPQLVNLCYILFSINVGLGTFNLIPFPPLDGSKILAAILPSSLYDKWMMFERYGMYILLLLLWTGVLSPILGTLMGIIQGFIFELVGLV